MNTVVLSMPELPPTLNEIIGTARRNKFASSNLKKRWHKKIEPYVLALRRMPGKVYIECVWIVKNKRRDPDNMWAATKFIFDTMVEYNRIDEDNMKIIQSPVIHHHICGTFDGFVMFIRDKEDFKKRLLEDVSLPPKFSGSSVHKISPNRARPALKSN